MVLLVAVLCAVAGYTAWANERGGTDPGQQPEIGTAVKLVRNDDGSVTTVRP